jgi:hypothetical protein
MSNERHRIRYRNRYRNCIGTLRHPAESGSQAIAIRGDAVDPVRVAAWKPDGLEVVRGVGIVAEREVSDPEAAHDLRELSLTDVEGDVLRRGLLGRPEDQASSGAEPDTEELSVRALWLDAEPQELGQKRCGRHHVPAGDREGIDRDGWDTGRSWRPQAAALRGSPIGRGTS